MWFSGGSKLKSSGLVATRQPEEWGYSKKTPVPFLLAQSLYWSLRNWNFPRNLMLGKGKCWTLVTLDEELRKTFHRVLVRPPSMTDWSWDSAATPHLTRMLTSYTLLKPKCQVKTRKMNRVGMRCYWTFSLSVLHTSVATVNTPASHGFYYACLPSWLIKDGW